MPECLGFWRVAGNVTAALEAIYYGDRRRVKTFGKFKLAIGTAFATNMVAGDPYISIALPPYVAPL